jgi:hypothetical protein
MLPYLLLPGEGISHEAMVDLFHSIVVNNQFDGRAVCPAGMNILHYLTLQPTLLTGSSNMMLKLLNLAFKLMPDVNGQVCGKFKPFLVCPVVEVSSPQGADCSAWWMPYRENQDFPV